MKSLYFTFLLYFTSTIHCQEKASAAIESLGGIHIHMSNSSQHESHASNDNTNSALAQSKTTTIQTQESPAYLEEAYKALRKEYSFLKQSSFPYFQSITNHKFTLVWYAALGLYGYLNFQLMTASTLLYSDSSWSRWKESLTIHELFDYDKDILKDELINKINQQHFCTTSPSKTSSHQSFMEAIESEIKSAQTYLTIMNRINLLKVSWLFLAKQETKYEIEKKLIRLQMIYSLFKEWSNN